jgi:anti-sigma factor RsiW
MQCDSAFTMLDAYLDGELSPQASAEIAEHLKGCTRCSSHLVETARLKRAVHATRGQFAPSAAFRQRIEKQVRQSRRRSWLLIWAPAAAAVMAALVLVVFILAGRRETSTGVSEIADLHINALASTNLVDVVSTDRHTVKPWFQGRIPFTFNLPEFSGTEFTLVGGRMVYFHQQPGAQLIVAVKQHKISVLIFQESLDMQKQFPHTDTVDERTSFGVETWHSKTLRFLVVSDADPAAIEKLAQLMRQANQ